METCDIGVVRGGVTGLAVPSEGAARAGPARRELTEALGVRS